MIVGWPEASHGCIYLTALPCCLGEEGLWVRTEAMNLWWGETLPVEATGQGWV